MTSLLERTATVPARSGAAVDLVAALAPLHARRSAQNLVAPAPDDAVVAALLEAACTVPDHGALRPYRFVVVRDAGREAFAGALEAAAVEARPGLPEDVRAKVRGKAFVAPMLVVLIASPQEHKVEAWEQVATACCAGYALTLAADLAGVGAVWKTAPFLSGSALTDLLGLGAAEQVLGWVNLGTRAGTTPPRTTPLAAQVATRLAGARTQAW